MGSSKLFVETVFGGLQGDLTSRGHIFQGLASYSQAGCQGFDSPRPLQFFKGSYELFTTAAKPRAAFALW